jgi:hypothetical protein
VSSLNWGDVPTWAAVVVGAVGGTAALIQLRQQGNVLKGEIERNKRRDELLDGQLRDLERRALLFERQQANYVLVEIESWSASLFGIQPPGPNGLAFVAVVTNHSDRPIRQVAARLEVTGETPQTATRLGRWVEARDLFGRNDMRFNTFTDGWCIDVIRADASGGFGFPRAAQDELDGQVMVRFTDDAGLHWQLDQDMRLVKLDDRDDW